MKKLLFISGKGGTGKTTVSSYFIEKSRTGAFADCDVDTPNLHLLSSFKGEGAHSENSSFKGGLKSLVDAGAASSCTRCGQCLFLCRFSAICFDKDERPVVDEIRCEGCGVCVHVCPQKVFSLSQEESGRVILDRDEGRVFSHARLKIGRGNSGKLVSEVKRRMEEEVEKVEEVAILDGAPGIGCPVISSLNGVSLAVGVAEPSFSALSDLERLYRTARIFGTPFALVINRSDLNTEVVRRLELFARDNDIPILGLIPFDETIARRLDEGRGVYGSGGCAEKALEKIYERTLDYLSSLR